MGWKTTWNDPLMSYLALYHQPMGDKRTRQTFDETIRGIIGVGSLICQRIAVASLILAKAKKDAQRVIRLASAKRVLALGGRCGAFDQTVTRGSHRALGTGT